MAEGLLPVPSQPALAQRQNPGGQIWDMVLGQDQETAVVDYQLKAVIVMAEVPTDPLIPWGTLQCRSGKTQKGYPLVSPGGDVPKGFSDLWQRAQVMMLLHQFLVALLFGWTNGPDKDLTQIQGSYSQDELY
jgi:hypothetical protein